ncbi:MAG: phosphoribosylanthranilate isomerase [Gemmatimonadota bacterium]
MSSVVPDSAGRTPAWPGPGDGVQSSGYRPLVKICGLTRPEDAEAAVRFGASYLGVIFAGGPREVSPDRASEIVLAADGHPVVGVFAPQDFDDILRIRDRTGLRGVQLHRATSAEECGRLSDEGLLVIQVLRLAGHDDLAQVDRLAAESLSHAVLVEPRVEGRLGGTGIALALEVAVEARRRLGGTRFFLAGGLTPESVSEAVSRVRPDAVDVSSGVEQIPGIKDIDRLARFMEAASGQHSSA